MTFHQELEDVIEDQLSLASIHYLRSHYQEAIDIYKRILLDNREYLALNVYVALCYYKLDYYDVSQEVLGAKYLVFFSSRSLKTREKWISFAQLVLLSLYIFRGKCVFTFQFLSDKIHRYVKKPHNFEFYHSKIEK